MQEDIAITEIDRAIGEIKHAAIDDGKDIHDHPAADVPGDNPPPAIRRWSCCTRHATGAREDDPMTQGSRDRALGHVHAAVVATKTALARAPSPTSTVPPLAPGLRGPRCCFRNARPACAIGAGTSVQRLDSWRRAAGERTVVLRRKCPSMMRRARGACRDVSRDAPLSADYRAGAALKELAAAMPPDQDIGDEQGDQRCRATPRFMDLAPASTAVTASNPEKPR